MNETEWFHDRAQQVDVKPRGLTILPMAFWGVVLALAMAAVLYAGKVFAEPVMRAEAEGVVVTIHKEDCALRDIVDAPKRATWQQDGKTLEGCVTYSPRQGLFLFYFRDDKSIVAIPVQMFARVTGA